MLKTRGLELEFLNQEINRGTIFLTIAQKINSTLSRRYRLTNGTLNYFLSQGGKF